MQVMVRASRAGSMAQGWVWASLHQVPPLPVPLLQPKVPSGSGQPRHDGGCWQGRTAISATQALPGSAHPVPAAAAVPELMLVNYLKRPRVP